MQQLQAASAATSLCKYAHACEVASRSVQAGDKPELDRVAAAVEDNRNRLRSLPWPLVLQETIRGNHGHLATNQIGRQCRQAIVLALGPGIFDRYVLALDIAGFTQALPERAQACSEQFRRFALKEPDHRHRRLLRPRRERPRNRRAAKKRDELPPPHVRLPGPPVEAQHSPLRSGVAGGR